MSLQTLITQIDSVDANAGNQINFNQTVGVANNPYQPGTPAAGTSQASTVPLASDGTPLVGTSTLPSLYAWFIVGCLAYFGYQWSK